MNLVVGATGLLGGEVCKLLAAESNPVRAIVRPTSDQTKDFTPIVRLFSSPTNLSLSPELRQAKACRTSSPQALRKEKRRW